MYHAELNIGPHFDVTRLTLNAQTGHAPALRTHVCAVRKERIPSGCMCLRVCAFARVRVRVRAQNFATSAAVTPLFSVSALDIPVPEAEDYGN